MNSNNLSNNDDNLNNNINNNSINNNSNLNNNNDNEILPNYFKLNDDNNFDNSLINGNKDLISLFGLFDTYETYVRPFIKQSNSNSVGEDGQPKRNKMESSFKSFIHDLPGRNTFSKRDSSITKVRDLLFEPEEQPPIIHPDSIDHSTIIEAFGKLPSGVISNVCF